METDPQKIAEIWEKYLSTAAKKIAAQMLMGKPLQKNPVQVTLELPFQLIDAIDSACDELGLDKEEVYKDWVNTNFEDSLSEFQTNFAENRKQLPQIEQAAIPARQNPEDLISAFKGLGIDTSMIEGQFGKITDAINQLKTLTESIDATTGIAGGESSNKNPKNSR